MYRNLRGSLFSSVVAVHLQGLGEPTLSPLFDEMVEDAIRHDLLISFVTNATALTPARIEKLAAARAQITVSIDGASRETHEYSRVGSDFAKVMEVVDHLKTVRESRSQTSLEVFFSTVVSVHNVMEIPDLIFLAAKNRVSIVSLLTPGVGDRVDEYAEASIGRHEDIYRMHLPAIVAAGKATGVTVLLPPHLLGSAAHHPGDEQSGNKSPIPSGLPRRARIFPQRCYIPFNEMYFDVDGAVRPCCAAIWISMGNVNGQSIKSIWNGRQYRLLRRAINSNNPPEFCRKCAFASGITGGDEHYLEKLYSQGLPLLPSPPKVGI